MSFASSGPTPRAHLCSDGPELRFYQIYKEGANCDFRLSTAGQATASRSGGDDEVAAKKEISKYFLLFGRFFCAIDFFAYLCCMENGCKLGRAIKDILFYYLTFFYHFFRILLKKIHTQNSEKSKIT